MHIRFIFFVFTMLFLNLACSKKEKIAESKGYNNIMENQKQTSSKENKNIKDLTYEESIKIYGNPLNTEEFQNAKDEEVFPGIRAKIGKHYPSGKNIIIKEAIWKKNDSIEIAIWYTKKENNWIPFDYFEYDKNTDF